MLAVLIAVLACSPSALARGGAGHNPATKKLEDAFKAALYVRSVSVDGCYPPAPQLAKAIAQRKKGLRTGVAPGPGSAQRRNIVYVLRSGSACNHIRMALLAGSGLYVLNSAQGNIRVQGKRSGPRTDPGKSGPARGVSVITNSFRLRSPNELERLESVCPGGKYPIGGGMTSSPAPDPDGEGIYPHSYERLGAQRGWHISEVLYDASPGSTTPRNVTLQTVCARGLVPANPSPHKTVFIRTGETKTATARCPKGQYLITGGFQRTDFTVYGGNYITESRADGPRAWRVTRLRLPRQRRAHRDRVLRQAQGPDPHRDLRLDRARRLTHSRRRRRRPVPPDLTLSSTGFSLNGSSNGFYAGSSLNSDRTSSATAFGYFGPAPQLTAYGYCLRAR